MMHISNDTHLTTLLAALGNDHRIEIVELLRSGERCVCEITPHLGIDASVVSRYLAILVHTGVLRSRREGRRVLYQIADHRVLRLLDTARSMTEHPDKGRPVGPKVTREAIRC